MAHLLGYETMVSQTLWAALRNWHIMAQWTHKLWQSVSRKLEINEYCLSGNSKLCYIRSRRLLNTAKQGALLSSKNDTKPTKRVPLLLIKTSGRESKSGKKN